jgi:hypothetical protein
MQDTERTPKGQFKSGTSGSPSGRPAGTRNKAMLEFEQMLEGNVEQVTLKLLDLLDDIGVYMANGYTKWRRRL